MSGVMLLANEMLIKELIEYYNTITKGTNKSQRSGAYLHLNSWRDLR